MKNDSVIIRSQHCNLDLIEINKFKLKTLKDNKSHQRKSEMIEQEEETEYDSSILIAVDSTLNRGGGILILPRTKQIYFYSLDWSKLEHIEEISKAQLLNITVALELFEDFVDQYRNSEKKDDDVQKEHIQSDLFFLTSNSVKLEAHDAIPTYVTSLKNIDQKYHEFFIELEDKLTHEPFWGNMKQISIGDIDDSSFEHSVIKMCTSLAEENCTFVSELPNLKNGKNFSNFSTANVSDSVTAMLALVSATLLFPN